MTNFNLPHLHLSPPYGLIPFEFRHDLWHQKLVMGLSCGVVCVILRLVVLIQYRSVTDTQTHRQTHRHTHRHTTTAYTALSKASRGKNVIQSSILMTFCVVCLTLLSNTHSNRDLRLHFFSERVVNRWNKLPASVLETTSVNSFKGCLSTNNEYRLFYGHSQCLMSHGHHNGLGDQPGK